MIKKIRIGLWVMVAIFLSYTAYGYFQVKGLNNQPLELASTQNPATDTPSFTPVAGFQPVGEFTLNNQDGEEFTQDSPAWNADYKLIYFGFASCPMICPTELQKMTKAINSLSSEQADKIQPIFITIDPARDTADSIKQYIGMFHPRFIGLTGTQDQIDHMLDIWKVYAKRVEEDSLTEYTMDHSSYIYLQNKDGQILGLFRIKDTAEDITNYLTKTIR